MKFQRLVTGLKVSIFRIRPIVIVLFLPILLKIENRFFCELSLIGTWCYFTVVKPERSNICICLITHCVSDRKVILILIKFTLLDLTSLDS